MTRQLRPPSELSTLQAVMQTSQRISVALGFLAVSAAQPTLAQSISIDGTTPTTLNGGNSCSGDCAIAGGLRDGSGSGPNLFHSFDTFNVDAGSTVTFTNPSGIDNIFSRVTGVSNLSHIDGTLKVDGPANLFLLNANGIVFGPNAQLDIQGSFLSSTASSLLFQDGSQFGAIPSQMPSLLTINVPVGLQFGTAASPIQIQGNGHSLSYNPDFTVSRGSPLPGLIAPNGKTLAFIGSGVTLAGGNVTAESGQIEVGSVGENSLVNIAPTATGWNFDYSEVNRFEDIQLTNQSALDVSGDDAGSIHLQGRNLSLSGGSAILAQVLTAGGGQIALDASESLSLEGVNLSATSQMPTTVYIEIASGATGDGSSLLRVNAPTLNLTAGGQIGLGMAGDGASGRIEVKAQTIAADNGSNAGPSSLFTAVLPTVFTGRPPATGRGGDLLISTEQLRLTNGAQFVASTFGVGDAGRLLIEAKNIEARGFNEGGPTNIASAAEFSFSGAGGSLDIRTDRLLLADGAQITVGTSSPNPAGNLTIAATDSVELRGSGVGGRSGLFASSFNAIGAGGNIQVNTQNLSLLEGATINVSNFPSIPGRPPGSGPAGNVMIAAGNVVLKDGSLITADTVSGDRANINLSANSLVLRRGSHITTNATGTATGGNINIDTQALIAFENSDITANAVDNFGGRVVVNAETILGTAYREQLTSESDITASSALGPAFSGSVELNSPDVDPTNGLTELPTGLAAADKIVAACEQTQSNAFVATGRGGLPEDASQLITNQSIWNDFRLIESTNDLPSITNETAKPASHMTTETTSEPSTQSAPIVEAKTWSVDSEGRVVLGLNASTPPSFDPPSNCLA
jgi:filamentous hemagglutinin family protein